MQALPLPRRPAVLDYCESDDVELDLVDLGTLEYGQGSTSTD